MTLILRSKNDPHRLRIMTGVIFLRRIMIILRGSLFVVTPAYITSRERTRAYRDFVDVDAGRVVGSQRQSQQFTAIYFYERFSLLIQGWILALTLQELYGFLGLKLC